MENMHRLTLLTAAVVPLALAASASAAHVDFFDAGPFSLTAEQGETEVHMQNVPSGPTGALGGQRIVQITNFAGDGEDGEDDGNGVTASLAIEGDGGNDDAVDLDFDDFGRIQFNYGSFTNDFADTFASVTGDFNADFLNIPNDDGNDTGMNWTRLEVDFDDPDDLATGVGQTQVTVTITSNSGEATASLSQFVTSAAPTLEFDYADFLAQDDDLDFTDIDGAQLTINGIAGDFYSIGFFNRAGNVPDATPIIPTPAALPAGLALMTGLMLRRRQS